MSDKSQFLLEEQTRGAEQIPEYPITPKRPNYKLRRQVTGMVVGTLAGIGAAVGLEYGFNAIDLTNGGEQCLASLQHGSVQQMADDCVGTSAEDHMVIIRDFKDNKLQLTRELDKDKLAKLVEKDNKDNKNSARLILRAFQAAAVLLGGAMVESIFEDIPHRRTATSSK